MLADVSPDAWFYEVLRVTGRSAAAPTIQGVACPITVLNSSYTAGVFTAFVAANVSGLLTLGFLGTAGGVRDLQVWRTSCSDPAAVFHPDFLRNIAGRCSTLRFLDFASINDATIVNWTDRVPMSWPQWAGGLLPYPGAPWEAAIAMANAIGADVWVQVPLTANDAYVVALAELLQVRGCVMIVSINETPQNGRGMQSNLASNATIYTEFSNEVWNDGFEQEHQQVAVANSSVTQDGDPLRLNYE